MGEQVGPWRQRALFARDVSLLATKAEDQWFERKSGRVDPRDLANVLVAFANAEGGTVVVGIEDDGRILGIEGGASRENDLRQAAIDFTEPPVRHTPEFVSAPHGDGRVMIVEVPPSGMVHRNRRKQVFQRIGDETRELGFDASQELMYDRGEREFDGKIASAATLADLDERLMVEYARIVDPEVDIDRIIRARNLTDDDDGARRPTWAGLLLLGHAPDQFLPSAFVRVLRYDGTEAATGTHARTLRTIAASVVRCPTRSSAQPIWSPSCYRT